MYLREYETKLEQKGEICCLLCHCIFCFVLFVFVCLFVSCSLNVTHTGVTGTNICSCAFGGSYKKMFIAATCSQSCVSAQSVWSCLYQRFSPVRPRRNVSRIVCGRTARLLLCKDDRIGMGVRRVPVRRRTFEGAVGFLPCG